MPHVQLPGEVRLYYEFRSAASDLGDSTKPSVILLAPCFLDSTFLEPYVEALRKDYAVTTVELRGQGRTIGGASPNYDYWVAAADLAFLMHALHLPPSHIFAPGHAAFRTALQFCILFPDQALSLSLVGGMSIFGPPRNAEAFAEVDATWSNPEDEDLFVECLGAVGEYVFTEYAGREEEWDVVIPAIARHLNPFRQADIYMCTKPNQGSSGITPDLLRAIRQPILLIHGERDLCFPVDDIREIRQHLTGSPDVRFHVEPDAPQLLAVTHVDSILPRLRDFLNDHRDLAYVDAPFDPSQALERAARVVRDPGVANRDPRFPDAFSLLGAEDRRSNRMLWDKIMARQGTCELDLPMCFDLNDWEEGCDKQKRWKWSTRHDYAQMHYSRRPSSLTSFGEDGVQVVEITESRSAPEKIPNGMTAYSTFVESRRPSVDFDSPTSDHVRAMSALRM
ncbi:alpha/beta-hydrolase [Rhodotorula sp. JG-1b]|nr:alpha/beta-hydrolase [Rhodotorula sp. JG-1b]